MDVRVANDLHAYEQTVERSMRIGPLLICNGLADFLRRILFNSKYALGHFSFRRGVLESTDLNVQTQAIHNELINKQSELRTWIYLLTHPSIY